MPVVPALLLALLAAGPLPPDLLTSYRQVSGPWGKAYLHPSGPELGAVPFESALERVEARIGRRRGRPFTAVVTPSRAEFERLHLSLTGRRPAEMILGVAFPDLDLLLVRGEPFGFLQPAGNRPRAVLEHEIAHLVLHRRPAVLIPRWLDEGIAQWAAGQLPEPRDEAFLSFLARARALYSLESLETELPASHNLAHLAYQQSALFLEWLVLRFGPGLPGDLLDALERGEPWREALERRTGLELLRLEREFGGWLAGKRPLWQVLLQSVSFWTLASLLALVAIARSIFRRRRALREMEERETREDLTGPAADSSWAAGGVVEGEPPEREGEPRGGPA